MTWKDKVAGWQAKESAELAAQHAETTAAHAETTAAMKALAEETEAQRKEHLAKMQAYAAEHGVGPTSTYSSGGGGRVQAGKGAVMAAPPPVEEVVGDDLTIIRGIGPGMQSRLNAAGLYTVAQLAGSTPEDLRRTLGEAVTRLANLDEWIEQARELAGMS